ncbi:MAG: hypothetical protein KDB53_00605, partial [Planctomycetes bacterium]|nr:hypothetical protein [Planctomycetota bacterium]
MVIPSCLGLDEAREEADRVAYGIVRDGREVAGQSPDPHFSVERAEDSLRSQLLAERRVDGPVAGFERLAVEGEGVTIDLETALAVAAANSREFQDQKERLYLTALDLSGALHRFESQWFGLIGLDGRHNGDGDDSSTLSIGESSSLGFTRLLERGGQLSMSIGDAVTRFLTNPASTSASAFFSLALA